MPVDTVITNCKIVRRDGILDAGVAIDRGKVVAIAKDDQLPPAGKTVDGNGNRITNAAESPQCGIQRAE